MIFDYKRRINYFVDKKVKELKKHQNQSQQVVLDHAQISNLFLESHFIPFTSWSISPSVILHILNDIVINERSKIIEFGSGASTLYIARLIQTLKLQVEFISVESNEKWFYKMKRELELYNLSHIVSLIYAPLVAAPEEVCLRSQKLWYDTNKINPFIENLVDIDLIIVDGPFGGSTPHARYSAIPFLFPKLGKNLGIFLDDTHRAEEGEIAEEWAKKTGLKLQKLQRYSYLSSDEDFITAPYKIHYL